MLKKYSLKALELAINKALSLDEQTPSRIKELDGKVLQLIIKPLGVSFFIQFANQKVNLLELYEGQTDTIIQSSPLGLIRLSLLPASKARSLFNDKISLSGDVELGQKVKQLFDEMDIDWEGHLAHFTGDVVAHQIGSFLRKGLDVTSRFTNSMRDNMTEYLQEELCVSPSKNEINNFFKEVDELALDVERLEAHVHQLVSQHEAN